jgi:signal transduction histidine kinase
MAKSRRRATAEDNAEQRMCPRDFRAALNLAAKSGAELTGKILHNSSREVAPQWDLPLFVGAMRNVIGQNSRSRRGIIPRSPARGGSAEPMPWRITLARRLDGAEQDGAPTVKIGTRLTLVLLLCVMPVLAAYTYWSVEQSNIYTDEMKQSARAAGAGLVTSLDDEVSTQQWNKVGDAFKKLDAEGTLTAVLRKDGNLWYSLPDFPAEAATAARMQLAQRRFAEFESAPGVKNWFCELFPLQNQAGEVIGYLLEVQDWSKVARDSRAQSIASLVVALVLLGVVATVIPLSVHRYVSRPLSELSAKVMKFSSSESDRGAGSEVELLSEEFRKLDQQLNRARSDLEDRHRHELELERELQRADRLATIGTLAAGLAHEIGTPMGVIRVRAEALQQDASISADGQAKLGVIVRQIDRIARIVRMLLDYARKSESHKAICDLRAIAERALALLEPEAGQRGVRIIARLGEIPLLVNCDADQIEQVFVNMIMNALDAMQHGGGTLQVTAQTEHSLQGSRAMLAFEDTGVGVAAENEDRLFSPFFTTKEPGKGTGMGLAVSQSIVREHDGEITFSTGPSGARFVVAIPMAAGETIEHQRGAREQRRE